MRIPWDGWNVAVLNNDSTTQVFYPLDGDISTNENYGLFRTVNTNSVSSIQHDINNPATAEPSLPAELRIIDEAVKTNQIPTCLHTRGVVWGAERPEALLTEGLAWHDRRVQDLELGASSGSGEDDEDSDDDNGQVSDDVQLIQDGE